MPSISRGRLFQFERQGDRARLLCLKSETGEFLWQFEYRTAYEDLYGYDNGPRCCPVVDDDRVYLFGPAGMLHALRVIDGKVLWKVDTRTAFGVVQNFFGVASTPVVEKDLLLVQVGGSPEGSDDVSFAHLKGNGSGIVAFDKRTGQVRYRVTDELASYASPVLATIGAGAGALCWPAAAWWAWNLPPAASISTFPGGRRSWRASMPAIPWWPAIACSSPKPMDPAVLCCGSSRVVTRSSGATSGRGPCDMHCHWMTPIFHEGYLYGCSGRHTADAELRCLELSSGKVMWSEPDLNRTSLLLVDGHFVCLGENGVLRLLRANPRKYEEVSRLVLREPRPTGQDAPLLLRYPCWAAPILAHGLLYVRGRDRLVCLELIPQK